MTLARFFEHMGPFIAGEIRFEQMREALGPLPSAKEDYLFYAHLLDYDQARILSEMYPPVRAAAERQGLDWSLLCRSFVRAHPPRGFSVPHVGEGFADWLVSFRASEPRLLFGIEAVADLIWTRFLAKTAPDEPGLGLDRRLFVRHYPVEAAALARALVRSEPLPAPRPETILVYRCIRRGTVREIGASQATIAVLLAESGAEIPTPLRLSEALALHETQRLREHGVLPDPKTQQE